MPVAPISARHCTVKSLVILGITILAFGLLTKMLIALLDDSEDGAGEVAICTIFLS